MHVLYIFIVCLVLLNLSQIVGMNTHWFSDRKIKFLNIGKWSFPVWESMNINPILDYGYNIEKFNRPWRFKWNLPIFFRESRNRKTMQTQKMSWIFCRTFSLNLHICLVLIYLHQIAGCDGYMWISKLTKFNLSVFQT